MFDHLRMKILFLFRVFFSFLFICSLFFSLLNRKIYYKHCRGTLCAFLIEPLLARQRRWEKNCTSHIWRRIDPLFFFFHSLFIALLCLQTISSLPPNIVSQQQHVIVCSHLLTYPRLFHIFNFFLFALRHLTIFFVRFYCSISCAVSRHRN